MQNSPLGSVVSPPRIHLMDFTWNVYKSLRYWLIKVRWSYFLIKYHLLPFCNDSAESHALIMSICFEMFSWVFFFFSPTNLKTNERNFIWWIWGYKITSLGCTPQDSSMSHNSFLESWHPTLNLTSIFKYAYYQISWRCLLQFCKPGIYEFLKAQVIHLSIHSFSLYSTNTTFCSALC